MLTSAEMYWYCSNIYWLDWLSHESPDSPCVYKERKMEGAKLKLTDNDQF